MKVGMVMKYCKNCGKELPDSAKFCGGCGQAVEAMSENNFDNPEFINENLSNNEIDKEKNKKAKRKSKYFIIAGIAIVVITILTVICLGLKDKKRVKEYEQYITMAENFMEELDYEQAEDTYLKAIEIQPKEREPYVRLAEIYFEQEEYEKVEDILNKADEAGAEQTTEQETKEEEIKEQIKEREEANEYSWVVEPTIEADDIFYLKTEKEYGVPMNEYHMQRTTPYAVIEKDGVYGIIDLAGEFITEISYYQIYNFQDDMILYLNDPEYVEDHPEEENLFKFNGEKVIASKGSGSYGVGMYYYCNGLQEAHDFYEKVLVNMPSNPFPIKKTDYVYAKEDKMYYEWMETLSDKYAVYYEDSLISDFIYEECGSFAEGLMAVCKDGKWGYINKDGEVVIPMEYDASWDQYSKYDTPWAQYSKGEDPGYIKYCYAASDGYVVLRKGDEWELRDTEGKVVFPLGIFEAIRPVYDGRCWVKKDGKWGIIELENSEITDSESKISDDMLEGIWLQENSSDAVQIIFDSNGDVKYYPTASHGNEYTTTYYLEDDQLVINLVHLDKKNTTKLKYNLEYFEKEKIKTCKIIPSEENKKVDVSGLSGWDETICGTYVQINLDAVKTALGVPEELEVDVSQSAVSYWDVGQIYTTYISIEVEGTLVASASVDALTNELVKEILMYANQSTTHSLEEICRIVEDHYNEEYNTDEYVVYEGDCSEKENGYYLILRTTKGNSANILVGGVTVDLTTGKVVGDIGEEWYLD